jgi:hypothetical protein
LLFETGEKKLGLVFLWHFAGIQKFVPRSTASDGRLLEFGPPDVLKFIMLLMDNCDALPAVGAIASLPGTPTGLTQTGDTVLLAFVPRDLRGLVIKGKLITQLESA